MLRGQKSVRETGAYVRRGAIARPRRQTKQARFLNQVRDDLTAHVGGKPSPTQRLLIERIAMTLLRIELMDLSALRDGTLAERQAREYLAWNNTVARMLRSLGLKSANRTDEPIDYLDAIGVD